MAEDYDSMIAGGVAAAGTLEVVAPFDSKPIGTIATADGTGVEAALATAHALYRDRDGWIPAHRRVEILERTAEIMTERTDYLAVEAAREGGKPLVDSRVEVARAIDGVKLCVETLRTQHGTEIPMGITASSVHRAAFTRHEPIGVVVAVSAFNHPLNLIVHQVGPAVASGCPVIVKPAGDTPLSCARFVSILREAGLPEEWCQLAMTSERKDATALVVDRRVGFFSFIGSAAVGWSLRSQLAPGARCALEHGGVAPVVVAGDADLDRALPLLAKGGFYHAGQVCVSVQRVFVDRGRARQVADGLAELGSKMVVGDPTDEATEVGPLIRHAEADRVEQWVAAAATGGAEVVAGGTRISPSCYSPTVLLDPAADAEVSTKEVFGPVVCVYSVDSIDEAIARANSLDVSFQAAVFTSDIDTAMKCYRHLDASAVMVNDHTAFRVDWMPFAGLKHSGHGVGGIHHTVHDMQIEKMMVLNSPQL